MHRCVRAAGRGAVLVALAAAAGCGASTSPGGAASEAALPTWDPPSDVRALSVTGPLVEDEAGCLRLDTGSVPDLVTPIWPEGYSLRQDGEVMVLVAESGDVVARVGQDVTIAGGSSSTQHDEQACGPTSEAPAFEVDQFIRGA